MTVSVKNKGGIMVKKLQHVHCAYSNVYKCLSDIFKPFHILIMFSSIDHFRLYPAECALLSW